MSKIETKELLNIVKESFEEQKGITILSLYFNEENNTIYGVYVLPPEQSLSFNEEPLLDMTTDIDGYNIIMQELGQMLLYSYNFGSIEHYIMLTDTDSNHINIGNTIYDKLLTLCVNNVPLQRFTSYFISWIELTDEVLEIRTKTFVRICQQYSKYDDLEYDDKLDDKDNIYIQQQFKDVNNQLKHKQHQKISELTISNINKLYVQLQIDLYTTDDK